ncbi:MAG TPA: hypothetical protein V6D18_18005 [Thermosynechococcaceae cyanobacterium]
MLLPVSRRPQSRPNLWFERTLAIVAAANLGLVLFNLSYVPWRNFWLQGNIPIPLTGKFVHIPIPQVDCPDRSVEQDQSPRTVRRSIVTCLYDPVKGIEPHRETQRYLNTVEQLQQQLAQKGIEPGLRSPEVQSTLQDLRNQSIELVDTNPFSGAGKSGTLEKIKNRMRQRINGSKSSRFSSREAFAQFWSEAYLAPRVQQEISWFNSEISPLLETNYYRSIDETGSSTDNFWLLDAPFIALFGLEFLARTFYISRRRVGLSWLDAILLRWYDGLLFFPFGILFRDWAWVRVVAVAIRSHQAKLVSLEPLRDHASRLLISSVAGEITEVVVVQLVSQVQNAVQRGEIVRQLLQALNQPQIKVNDVDEVATIASLLVKLTLFEVLPKVQPELVLLLTHNVENVLNQSPVYQTLRNLPGMADLPSQLTQTLINEVIQATQKTFSGVMEDRVGAELSAQFVQHFGETLISELQQQNVTQEIQSLLVDLLEELKLNYVRRSGAVNTERLLDQTRQLHQKVFIK